MNVEEARASFPGLLNKVFLDAAAVSLTPVEARERIESFVDLAGIAVTYSPQRSPRARR